MRKKIYHVMCITSVMLLLSACGKQEDKGFADERAESVEISSESSITKGETEVKPSKPIQSETPKENKEIENDINTKSSEEESSESVPSETPEPSPTPEPTTEFTEEDTVASNGEGEPVEHVTTEEEISYGEVVDNSMPAGDAPAISIVLETSAPGIAVESNDQAVIDYSNTSDGYFMAAWTGGSGKIKLQATGPSGVTYTYNLRTDGAYDAFPISDGNGNYEITIYKNVQDTKYAQVLSAYISVSMSNEMAPFLRPNQYVNYKDGSNTVNTAAQLCAGIDDNLQKVEKVYDYVVANISYDYNKANTVQSGYLPVLDDVLNTRTGICFDYASLMTGMLRSQGVPCKLVVGYSGAAYHAWINVWSESEGWVDSMIFFDGYNWKLMDPTFASGSNKSQEIMNYIENGANYQAKYWY